MSKEKPNPFDEELEKKPGSYQLILRSTRSVVDPSDKLTLELYISGFGSMQFSKLVFFHSADVFDSSSEVLYGPEYDVKNKMLYWGVKKAPIDPRGDTIELNVLTPAVLFASRPSLQVTTERSTTNKGKGGETSAPIKFNLRIKKEARPGKYHVHFILTYFDGEKWSTTSTRFQFSIRNLLEQYAPFASGLAIVAGFSAIIAAIPEILKLWYFLGRFFET